eukprot:m.105540 g.105540  ORF g.105540 m.105540 type:complete len:80 (-) comp9146_c0_seq3:133-372(-)
MCLRADCCLCPLLQETPPALRKAICSLIGGDDRQYMAEMAGLSDSGMAAKIRELQELQYTLGLAAEHTIRTSKLLGLHE